MPPWRHCDTSLHVWSFKYVWRTVVFMTSHYNVTYMYCGTWSCRTVPFCCNYIKLNSLFTDKFLDRFKMTSKQTFPCALLGLCLSSHVYVRRHGDGVLYQMSSIQTSFYRLVFNGYVTIKKSGVHSIKTLSSCSHDVTWLWAASARVGHENLLTLLS